MIIAVRTLLVDVLSVVIHRSMFSVALTKDYSRVSTRFMFLKK